MWSLKDSFVSTMTPKDKSFCFSIVSSGCMMVSEYKIYKFISFLSIIVLNILMSSANKNVGRKMYQT